MIFYDYLCEFIMCCMCNCEKKKQFVNPASFLLCRHKKIHFYSL